MSGRPIGQFLTVATPSGRLLAAMTVCECGGRPMGLISGLSDGGPAGGVGEGGGTRHCKTDLRSCGCKCEIG